MKTEEKKATKKRSRKTSLPQDRVFIEKTKDYSMFNFADENRNLDLKHVQNLVESIKEKNLIQSNPIIVDSKMTILDGQHRFEALKIMDLPIYYKVDDKFEISDISRINTVSKKWDLNDYLKHYVSQKYSEYIELNKFVAEYDVNIYSAIGLLSGRTSQPNAELIKKFKTGTFIVKDYDNAVDILEKRDDFEKYSDKFYTSKTFLNALSKLIKQSNYDHERMLDKIELQPRSFVKCTNVESYLEMFEEIYNYRSKKKEALVQEVMG